ncbi:RNA polymerase sigma factor [Blautia schinkii]|nr:RNA polymerase sigma factor [Blautia schinkii]
MQGCKRVVSLLENELLEKLYKQYYRELYVYIYAICRQKVMTEDVLQETFLKAFTALKESHTNMRAWLYVVARNLCLNGIRKEKNMIASGEIMYHTPAAMDVLEKIIADEQARELTRALMKLSNPKREVLILQYFGGFKQREIAAMLQLTPENVRVLSLRGKKDLKILLEVNRDELS